MVPPHELVPAAASDVSVRTYNPFRLEPSLPAPSENPSTHDPLMERVIPTDAQISTFSELEGAVYHFAGPLVDMARVVVASRLDPRWDLEAVRRMTRDCLAYAGKQQPLSRASLELRAMEETVEVSEVEVGSGDEDRERDESETTWSRESGCWRVAPMPTPRPMEAARGLHPMPVVIPQTDGDALSNDKDKSTTSTHEVDNPAGEPVIELVPLSSGGPMTSWSADDQPEAPGPEDAPQPQPGNPYPKPTAVIDETVYGSDPPRLPAMQQALRARIRSQATHRDAFRTFRRTILRLVPKGRLLPPRRDRPAQEEQLPAQGKICEQKKGKAKVEYPGSGQFWWTPGYDGDSDGGAAGSLSTVS